jgi:hypothetical protein
MFTADFRDRVRDRVLELARGDARVVAGAVVGSAAQGGGDRWSDLDLTFGVEDGVPVTRVADDWGAVLRSELEAAHLFDLWRESAVYRVFLLPGCLQVDLSFAPASEFGARGPGFGLLFGAAVDLPPAPAPAREELFGLAVHHAVRARFCIERGRVWQAEFWIHTLRDHVLELACLNRGLPVPYGRGFDALPAEAHDESALVRSAQRDDLLRALGAAVAMLVREAPDLAAPLDARFRELAAR